MLPVSTTMKKWRKQAMEETHELYGKKAYSVFTSIKAANIIALEMEAEISSRYTHEWGIGCIKIIPSAGSVKVEVWPDDDDLGDLPWWLLTYSDFMAYCKEILENNKEMLV